MQNKILNNAIWMIGGQVVKTIISLVVSVLTARYLGPSNYGIIGYVSTFIIVLTAFSNLGLGNILIKEFVHKKENSENVIKTCIVLQLISSSISYIVAILLIFLFNINNVLMLQCATIQCLSLIFSSFESINYFYQSRYESKKVTLITLISYIIVQVYKVILLITNSSVIWFSTATMLDTFVFGFGLVILFKKDKFKFGKYSKQIAKTLLKQSSPFILTGVISVLYASIDKIMLNALLNGTESVAYYNVANSLSQSWVFIISSIITAFTPLIYEIFSKDKELYKLRTRQLYCLIFWLSAFICICLDIVAPFAIPWLYGGLYNESIIPTMILTWAVVFSYLGVARLTQFICENLQKYLTILSIMTVIINIALNLLFIPIFGVSGAAIATLISEAFVCIIGPILFSRTRPIGINILKGIVFKNIQFKDMIKSVKDIITKRFKKVKLNKDTLISETVQSVNNAINKDDIGG